MQNDQYILLRHREYVGCPRELHMEQLKGAKIPQIFLSTEAGMIASLKASNGQISIVS